MDFSISHLEIYFRIHRHVASFNNNNAGEVCVCVKYQGFPHSKCKCNFVCVFSNVEPAVKTNITSRDVCYYRIHWARHVFILIMCQIPRISTF